jgi:hypothetical protein
MAVWLKVREFSSGKSQPDEIIPEKPFDFMDKVGVCFHIHDRCVGGGFISQEYADGEENRC